MKKFLFHFAAVAVVATTLLTTSCTKDEGNIYRLKIHQYTSADKTSLGDGGVTLWSNGDEVYVNGTTTVQISGNVADYETSIDERLPIDGRLYCFYAGNATMAGFDATTKTFTYTMPSSVNYDGTKLNAPMVGANDGNDVDFENICTMLKLEFFKIPTTITITSESTAISGTGFSASYNGSSWTATAPAVTSDNKTITITNNNYMPYVYVPLPAGNHKLTITATGGVDTKAMTSAQTMAQSTIYPIHFAHPFSVSATKKVYFSPGNLQYNPSNSEWSFAANQWDFLTSIAMTQQDGGYSIEKNVFNGITDVFRWGTSGYGNTNASNPKYFCWNGAYHTSNDLSINDYDWGYNAISNGGNKSGLWRTLSKDEFQYLLSSRTNTVLRYAKATVNNVMGLIIFPDGTESCGIINSDNYNTKASLKNIPLDSWNQDFSSIGCVFLPNGYFYNTGASPYTSLNIYTGGTVYYWTSTIFSSGDKKSYHLSVAANSTNQPGCYSVQGNNYYDHVRLVRDAN